MPISPRTVLRLQAEARRHLIATDSSSCRKVVDSVAARVQRRLSTARIPLLQQAAPTTVQQESNVLKYPPLNVSFATSGIPEATPPASTGAENVALRHLPLSCPGCGGFTQEVEKDEPGFYTRSRRTVRDYIRRVKRAKVGKTDIEPPDPIEKEAGVEAKDQSADLVEDDVEERRDAPEDPLQVLQQQLPLCDRCHALFHQSQGAPIAHPTIDSIADTIAESPYRRNHVYHVLDAVDFPLSLVPRIFNELTLARPRSQNRRSQHDFSFRTTVSFIITRSDLLAPQKEMVDTLMPYFTSVLRQALGRRRQDMRLGNVHLVSAKRGWWTKEIKEEIRSRGGGNWMVGKFNVGKSNLFEVLFPKGDGDQAPVYSQIQKESGQLTPPAHDHHHHHHHHHDPTPASSVPQDLELLSETALLPPAQRQTPYPTMPLVSPLPGTTASPIRLPFGPASKPKGELIDLPGLPRSYLRDYVVPAQQRSLVMETRPSVTQHVLKPGQSLLLGGGLIRMTPMLDPSDPNEKDLVFMLYPFVPITAHVTSNEKAELTQQQQRESGIETILESGAGEAMRSAGVFALDTDVTKVRSGALLRAGVKLEQLPFRVMATDVLISGLGWVEVVCQVRRRKRRDGNEAVMQAGNGEDFEGGGGPRQNVSSAALNASTEYDDPQHRHQQHEQDHDHDHDQQQQHETTVTYNPIKSSPPPFSHPTYPTPSIQVFHPMPGSASTTSTSTSTTSNTTTSPNSQHPPSAPTPTQPDAAATAAAAQISTRTPLNAWHLLHGPTRPGKTRSSKLVREDLVRAGKGRPRRSMKGVKKMGKMGVRAGIMDGVKEGGGGER